MFDPFDPIHYQCLYESTQKMLETANRKIEMLEQDLRNANMLLQMKDEEIEKLRSKDPDENRWEWMGQ